MTDPMDQPEPEGYSLAVPFVACQSQGGPYDDDAFVAGFRCGEIDKTLAVAASMGATEMQALTNAEGIMRRQLDLIAMHRGYTVRMEPYGDAPEWVQATFTASTVVVGPGAPTT